MQETDYALYKEHEEDRHEIDKINLTIANVIDIFYNFYSALGWAYEIIDGTTTPKNPIDMSYSTCAMILHSLLSATGRIRESIISNGISQRFFITNNHKISRNQIKNIEEVYKSNFEKIVSECLENKFKFYSHNFGNDDPFTYSWFLEILFQVDTHDADLKQKIKDFDSFKSKIIMKSLKIVENSLKLLAKGKLKEKGILNWPSKGPKYKSLEHAFPLLKVIYIFLILQKNLANSEYINFNMNIQEIEHKYKNAVAEYTLNRIHQHLAFYDIKDSEFDVAELVLSLESHLLLVGDTNYLNFNLIERVFQIVQKSQSQSAYWRPLKPFVSTSSGLVLLPLSIEIVNSLLRICKMVENANTDEHLFSDYVDIFKRYTSWLLSRLVKGQCTDCHNIQNSRFQGWHSENVLEPKKVHPWDTSQTILFLLMYQSALQKHIAYRSLIATNLHKENQNRKKEDNKLSADDYWELNWQQSEPLDGLSDASEYRILKKIGQKYIKNRVKLSKPIKADEFKYSMLLYGPPGTGKSTVAEEIAKSLQWDMITITPSNFIAKGESEVENRANKIFQALMEQENFVIFFDEIDRLILDRESGYYLKQSDIFQFMTPGMLVKIRNLRKEQNLIFIIATNFNDRIDAAIKRSGRIDEQFFVAPPDAKQRVKILNKIIKGKIDSIDSIDYESLKTKLVDTELKNFIDKTVLYKFGELERVISELINKWISDTKQTDTELLSILNDDQNWRQPELRLASYKKRFSCYADRDNPFLATQEPHDEFFLLLYMIITESTPNADQKEMFEKIIEALAKKHNNFKTEYELVLKDVLKDDVIAQVLIDFSKEEEKTNGN